MLKVTIYGKEITNIISIAKIKFLIICFLFCFPSKSSTIVTNINIEIKNIRLYTLDKYPNPVIIPRYNPFLYEYAILLSTRTLKNNSINIADNMSGVVSLKIKYKSIGIEKMSIKNLPKLLIRNNLQVFFIIKRIMIPQIILIILYANNGSIFNQINGIRIKLMSGLL